MNHPKEWMKKRKGQPDNIYGYLKEIVTFRGRQCLSPEYMETILPKLDSSSSGVALKVRVVQTLFLHAYPILECTIGEDRYFTYKSPRNKEWDDDVLDAYLKDEQKGNKPLVNIKRGDIKAKEDLLGIRAVTLFQLSKIIDKALTEQKLQDDFKYIYEEFLLTNI